MLRLGELKEKPMPEKSAKDIIVWTTPRTGKELISVEEIEKERKRLSTSAAPSNQKPPKDSKTD
jgi:hypothetical protein